MYLIDDTQTIALQSLHIWKVIHWKEFTVYFCFIFCSWCWQNWYDAVGIEPRHPAPRADALMCYAGAVLKKHGFSDNGVAVEWAHIEHFVHARSRLPIRMAPKLTMKHITIFSIECQIRSSGIESFCGSCWLWYHILTAHQHQKGHTVPKQVIMIATSIQVATV